MRPATTELILVTDPRWDRARIAEVTRVLAGEIPGFSVQLRDRSDCSDDELEPFAQTLRRITADAHAGLIVNRRLALARRVGADGFHAPAADLVHARDFAWRSAPAHADADVPVAERAGATAVLVSPIYDVPDKGPPRGIAALRTARSSGLLVVALGGIDERNARACWSAGADAVAVMRVLLDAGDPVTVAKCLVRSRA